MAQWAVIKTERPFNAPFVGDRERESKWGLGFNNLTKVRSSSFCARNKEECQTGPAPNRRGSFSRSARGQGTDCRVPPLVSNQLQ